jgi:hypothetical protein
MRGRSVTRFLWTILLIETLAFALAASIHGGAWVDGFEHRRARIAESAIAGALALTLVAAWLAPRRARRIALAGQSIALLGTAVGLFTVAIGVGPRTVPDVVYHVAMPMLLVRGIAMTRGLAPPRTGGMPPIWRPMLRRKRP